jgi:hypothetical protein
LEKTVFHRVQLIAVRADPLEPDLLALDLEAPMGTLGQGNPKVQEAVRLTAARTREMGVTLAGTTVGCQLIVCGPFVDIGPMYEVRLQ